MENRDGPNGSTALIYIPAMVMMAALVISNVLAVKLAAVNLGPFGTQLTDGGLWLFPLAYWAGDTLAEVYGLRRARKVILASWLIMAVIFGAIWGAVQLPAAADSPVSQEAFAAVFSSTWRIVLASLVAYLVGELVNATIVSKLKLRLEGRRRALRFIGSSLVAQVFDTVIFGVIAFGGQMQGAGAWVSYIGFGVVFKTAVEAVVYVTLTWWVIRIFIRKERVDILAVEGTGMRTKPAH